MFHVSERVLLTTDGRKMPLNGLHVYNFIEILHRLNGFAERDVHAEHKLHSKFYE